MTSSLRIDIVSDIACPWCAIGYAHLERAMEQLSAELAFDIEWHAFELDPGVSAEGEPILQALSRKYGRSPAEMQAAQAEMMEIAEGLGLNFSKMQERYTRNTFDAHRLVKWAAQQGRSTDMKMALFEAYFGRAEDIADSGVLVRCAEAIGLDGSEAKSILDSDEYADAVRADEAHWHQSGVTAVPAFIINGKYLISGAQQPETLIQAFQDIVSEK